MTEQDYINVSDQAKVRNAIEILNQILPVNSYVILNEEYNEVMSTLAAWEERLRNEIRVD